MPPGRRSSTAPNRVVGIGASAGGLEAFTQLVARLPADSGLAYLVHQHLPPAHSNQLVDLLARATEIRVVLGEAGQRVDGNTIYVVQANVLVAIDRGTIVLRATKPVRRTNRPIDALFASLASVLEARAIGVVLSGTGQDGSEGLREIQRLGGLTFAQEPSTAQFEDMPRSAIAAGVAEIVLPAEQIGVELGALARLAPTASAPGRRGRPSSVDTVLERLRETSGIDFSSYKRSTIERRLALRLGKLGLHSLAEYTAYLAKHPDEARDAYEDLLIHVTEFFRNPGSLDRLVEKVFPALFENRPSDVPVRVWVPGCSTGEEVYTLAMLLVEFAGNRPHPIQVFGSDLSERTIDTARRGIYTAAVAEQVGPERLARYFQREDGGYRVVRELRERCVFVRHDLVRDPPFSKLDLVSCRNVLIYLGPVLQQRVMPIFHYALNQPGYLLLGGAESVTGFETLFDAIDADARIYVRKPAARAALTFPPAIGFGVSPLATAGASARSMVDVQRDVDHALLARYAPACVLVDENFDIVQFRGRTGPYLEAPAGHPQLSVLKMARSGLAIELPLALKRAQRDNAAVREENIAIHEPAGVTTTNLQVLPIAGPGTGKRYFLVVFEVAELPRPAAEMPVPGRKAVRSRDRAALESVRQELETTKEHLRALLTQQLATTEELGIKNEELQSANEELQSSNEELQTAKEELQSANEELETVNEELQRGNAQLRQANDDLGNVLASVEIAIIIVDPELRVRRFTPRARELIKLITSDLGRPIGDLQTNAPLPDLEQRISDVIRTLTVHEAEVHGADGTTYRMQIRPYRTADQRAGGAVLAFVDITALRVARDYATSIVETAPTPLVVIDAERRIRSANRAFGSVFRVPPEQVVGKRLLELGTWRDASLRQRLDDVLGTGAGFDELEISCIVGGEERALLVGARRLPPFDHAILALVAIVDITERRRLEQVRETARRERDFFLDAVSHELRTPLSAILLWAEALRGFESSDPRHDAAIDTIAESARAEAQLVDDLLDLAVSRTTELTVEPIDIDPSKVVADALAAARPDADAKGLAVEAELADGTIRADPRRLRQIVTNLVANAIKFTPPGGRITVSLGHADDTMQLVVRDTGAGMPTEFVSRAFEPFARADPSSTRSQGGLGIGLALVRYLVERQGGTIDAASPGPGKGSMFTVRLPVRRN